MPKRQRSRPRSLRWFWLAPITVALYLLVALTSADLTTLAPVPSYPESAPSTMSATPDAGAVPVETVPVDTAKATAQLAALAIKGRAPKTGYDRAGSFGAAWIDVDRNGCDTRNDILARDLEDEVTSGPCRVLSGVLHDPYTAETITFVRGNTTSTLVQIDHVVALMDSWQKGAQQLSAETRVAFANDPLNLLAVDGRSNSAKGAGDAATWLPPNRAFRCEYVARQIAVKTAYALWVTRAEHDAMAAILASCEA